MSETLKDRVVRAMNNARDNGYDETHIPPDDVVLDLLSFDADLEMEEPEAVYPFVVEWQKARRD